MGRSRQRPRGEMDLSSSEEGDTLVATLGGDRVGVDRGTVLGRDTGRRGVRGGHFGEGTDGCVGGLDEEREESNDGE